MGKRISLVVFSFFLTDGTIGGSPLDSSDILPVSRPVPGVSRCLQVSPGVSRCLQQDCNWILGDSLTLFSLLFWDLIG